ncbi:MAG: agmatinase [Acidobacteriota bacterium]
MKNTRLALIGFPFDRYSSYLRGAAQAPPLIRQAFRCPSSNMWTESGIDLENAFFDAGDVDFSSVEAFALIESAITDLLDRNLAPISLGGDHSITYPIIRAFRRKYPRLSILHFDAHSDIYDVFEGNRFSHACPFARIMEEGLVERLVQVGIRTLSRHQREQVARFGVEVHEMKDWRDDIKLEFDSPLYISFDMDGLDPACSPGVSHPEPGGLTTRQAVGVIQSVRACVVGADIVEFNPARDVSGITAMACAKLLKEIAAQTLEQGEGKEKE